jgi:F-type H+-transporting ATPase subunit c
MNAEYVKAAACIGAAIAMGVGGIGPALGQGLIGMKACESVGKYKENSAKVRTAMIIAMAIVESTAVYALLIAGALVYIAFTVSA